MLRGLVAVVLVFILWTGSAGATELTGFGPIKFGMTKEEASAALEKAGIEGKWQGPNLAYKYDLKNHHGEFEALQYFGRNGRAGAVQLQYKSNRPKENIDSAGCHINAMKFAAAIEHKYGKRPISRQGVETSERSVFYGFVFGFDNFSYIEVSNFLLRRHCMTFVVYHPASEDPQPF